MTADPAGYYATLEVAADAESAEITAAYRRKARVVHPDVPDTGDAEAFVRLKAAYDIVSDPSRRAAYDRAARFAEAPPPHAPQVAEPATRGPRLSDLPITLWAGLGGVFCLAAVMATVQFNRSPVPPASSSSIRPFAPPATTARPPPAPPATALPAGPTTHYVLPGSGDAVVWRRDPTRDAYVPAGHVEPFSAVHALSLVSQHGLVEIRLADGGSGFVDAGRLNPGDGMTARRAYCAYNAGTPPANGEVLNRAGEGPAQLEIANRTPQPAVVKLRDASGRAAVTVFVAPGSIATVVNLPNTALRPDFAIGELWSRACNDFAAGMRAQRFAGYASPSGLSPLLIPPEAKLTPAPMDISEAVFAGD